MQHRDRSIARSARQDGRLSPHHGAVPRDARGGGLAGITCAQGLLVPQSNVRGRARALWIVIWRARSRLRGQTASELWVARSLRIDEGADRQ